MVFRKQGMYRDEKEMIIKKIQFIVIGSIFLFYCNNSSDTESDISYKGCTNPEFISFSYNSIAIEGDLNGFQLSLSTEKVEDGLEIIKIKLSRETPAVPPQFQLKWKFPSNNIQKYWNPNHNVDRVNYYYNSVTSSSTRLAPVLSFTEKTYCDILISTYLRE